MFVLLFLIQFRCIIQLNQIIEFSMAQHPSPLAKTPEKWQLHPIRIRPNIPALTRPTLHPLKLPHSSTRPSIANKTAKSFAQSPLESPQSSSLPAHESNGGQLGDLSCSPSLKTQKKQYLKLFTTASTNRQESANGDNSNCSMCSSSSADNKPPISSYKGQNADSPEGELADRAKGSPRRRLFSDLGIQSEERIVLEQNNGQPYVDFPEFLSNMPKLPPLSMSQIPDKTEEGEEGQQMFQICSGCFKFLPTENMLLHQEHCLKFQDFHSMNPSQQLALIRSVGAQLMRRIESQAGGLQSGDLVSLVGHCHSFLKECELAWSTGRPSEIYNFKLKELQLSSNTLVRCVQDIHRLNFLLFLQQAHPFHSSPLQ